MALYKIEWKKSAVKDLKNIPKRDIEKIINKVGQLAEDPFSSDIRKLHKYEFYYRLRIGDYRVIFEIINDILVIHVIAVGHRKEIYKLL